MDVAAAPRCPVPRLPEAAARLASAWAGLWVAALPEEPLPLPALQRDSEQRPEVAQRGCISGRDLSFSFPVQAQESSAHSEPLRDSSLRRACSAAG